MKKECKDGICELPLIIDVNTYTTELERRDLLIPNIALDVIENNAIAAAKKTFNENKEKEKIEAQLLPQVVGEVLDKEINPITGELKKKKVAIIGFAPSWKEVPWEDPDMEFWTLNEAYLLLQSCKNAVIDRWIEIHNLTRPPKNDPKHVEFLNKLEIPFYTLEKWDFITNKRQIAFPYKEIVKWLSDRGHIGSRLFTNSVSWMIGLALLEGFEEIHVYGVDMSVTTDKNGNSEYGYQKPSCLYLLGIAEKYSKVYVPETSDLFSCGKLYAFEDDNERYVYLKKQLSVWEEQNKLAQQQLQEFNQKSKQIEYAVLSRNGAMEAYRTLLNKRL